MDRLTFRPYKMIWLIVLEVITFTYTGWLGAILVLLASIDLRSE